MFDPTIFDNLKVVLEGELYDLDREGRIQITGREDLIDLAEMGRTFRMKFVLPKDETGDTVIQLSSSLSDFAAELAKIRLVEASDPGCQIMIRHQFSDWKVDRSKFEFVEKMLNEWWSGQVHILQWIQSSFQSGGQSNEFQQLYLTEMVFLQKINEQHMEKLTGLLNHVIGSYEKVKQVWYTDETNIP